MEDFEVYHLKQRELNRLALNFSNLKSHNEDDENKLATLSRELKLAETLLDISPFKLIKEQGLMNTELEVKRKSIWTEKARAAKALLATQWYSHVATVSCESAMAAKKKTTNSIDYWFNIPNKQVMLKESAWRDTGTFDIIKVRNTHLLLSSSRFYSIELNKFIQVS